MGNNRGRGGRGNNRGGGRGGGNNRGGGGGRGRGNNRGGGRGGGNNNHGGGGNNGGGGRGGGRGQQQNHRGRGGGRGGPPPGNWAFSNNGQRWDQPNPRQSNDSGGAQLFQQAFKGPGGFSQPSSLPWGSNNGNVPGSGNNINPQATSWATNGNNILGNNSQGNAWPSNGTNAGFLGNQQTPFTNQGIQSPFNSHSQQANAPGIFSADNSGTFSKGVDMGQNSSVNALGIGQQQQQSIFTTNSGHANAPNQNPTPFATSSNGFANQGNQPGLFSLPEHKAVNGEGSSLPTESTSSIWSSNFQANDNSGSAFQQQSTSLTAQEKAAFDASDFEDGCIPEVAPPPEYR